MTMKLISCQRFLPKNLEPKNKKAQEETHTEYLYNIEISDLFVKKEIVNTGENVGNILNKHNISFTQIDKIAKMSKKNI